MPRRICFVCGSYGADNVLHTRPRDKGSYFAFLENHDPPKGARLPTNDGVIDSCPVCYAFLTQQWETYERTKTPIIKRLYWLKRADNGHFTGAEMRLQGEYIAQVMGLQYPTSGFDASGPIDSYYDESIQDLSPVSQPVQHNHSNAGDGLKNHSIKVQSDKSKGTTLQANSLDSAMDLSVPNIKQVAVKPLYSESADVDNNHSKNSKKFFCFLCGNENLLTECFYIESKFHSDGIPYFPFLEKVSPPRGALPLSKQGTAIVCLNCKDLLHFQWKSFEMAGLPHYARTYRLNNNTVANDERDITKYSDANKAPTLEVCYICTEKYQLNKMRPTYTCITSSEMMGIPYFPFIQDLSRPSGARPLAPDGTVLSCQNCFSFLYNQWKIYETDSVPLLQRRYLLTPSKQKSDTKASVKSSQNSTGSRVTPTSDVYHPLNIEVDSPSSSKVPHSSRTSQGLLAIAPDAELVTNADPHSHSIKTSKSSYLNNSEKNSFDKKSQKNLQTSSDSSNHFVSTSTTKPAQVDSACKQTIDAKSIVVPTVPHPLAQAGQLPKKICFLCGEQCLATRIHILCSYPVRHDVKTLNGQVTPFFPFLANRDPSAGSEQMTEDGTVSVCFYCYYMLLNQWNDFETSSNPADSNRWLRKYVMQDFFCYVCGISVLRKNVHCLKVSDFQFLKDHKAPPGSFMIDNGESVTVCKPCYNDLNHQFSEYQRLGLPKELRKYNWMQKKSNTNIGDENSNDSVPEQGNSEYGSEISRDAVLAPWVNSKDPPGKERDENCIKDHQKHTGVSEHLPVENIKQEKLSNATENTEYHEGLPQGAKPPPLTMLSPSASKISRNTATVPPLSQVSPSNGITTVSGNSALSATRTSSFAAALRKLATQAKDPEDMKHITPPSTGSPGSTTSKRGPPPLVFTSQSTSALSSPPVVTIAPTQTHPSVMSSDRRQSIEQLHSTHSLGSASYDPLIYKQERDQRPLSSHSRDDDRASSKDGSLLGHASARIVTPHSTPVPTTPLSHEDSIARGFQPYRPGEEVRHPLPPSYAMDPSYAAYSHLFPHHPFPHPAFRFDDPMMIDRYQQMMLPSAASYMPISHPGLMPHPSLQLMAGRYPPEMLHQQYPYLAGTRLPDSRSPLLSAERQRLEEERMKNIDREREKEREKEIEKLEREKIERIRTQELEKRKMMDGHMAERNYMEHSHSNNGEHRSDRHDRKSGHDDKHYRISATDFSVSKYGSITQGTSREQSNQPRQHNSQSTYSSRSDINRSDLRNKFPGSSSSHNKPVASVISNVAEKRRSSEEAIKTHPPPLVSPKKSTETAKQSGQENHLFRPFDTSKVLANGYDSKTDVSLYGKVSQAGLTHDSSSQCSASDKSHSVSVSSSNKHNDHSSPRDYTKSTLLNAENKKDPHSLDSAHKAHSDSSKSPANNGMSKSTLDYEGLHPNFFRSGLIQNSLLFNLEHFPHITSKLDLEEKKLRDARSSGNYDSEDDDSCVFDEVDETEKDKLTLIKSGPPLKLNSAPKKLEHLGNLGLTTQNLEFEKLLKRKKRLKESNVIEVDADKKTSQLNIPDVPITPDLAADTDYEDKCKFLSMLGVAALKAEEKKELEEIRQVCEAERQRRFGPVGEDCSDREKKDLLLRQGRGTKRKFNEDDSSDLNVSLLDPLIQLKMAHSQKPYSNFSHSHSKSDPCAILFPERQRQLSREFAQEFHKSVLQSTRQKDNLNKPGICSTNPSDLPGIRISDASRVFNEKSSGSIPSSSAGSYDCTESDAYRWPGIESVLTAYQKHKEEANFEKRVLSGRCKKLSQDNSELNQTASSLSRTLSELLEAKQNQEAERLKTKSAIDNLKRCLKQLR